MKARVIDGSVLYLVFYVYCPDDALFAHQRSVTSTVLTPRVFIGSILPPNSDCPKSTNEDVLVRPGGMFCLSRAPRHLENLSYKRRLVLFLHQRQQVVRSSESTRTSACTLVSLPWPPVAVCGWEKHDIASVHLHCYVARFRGMRSVTRHKND